MVEQVSGTQPESVDLYTDGGSQPNPGPSAIGLVILSPAGDQVESAGLRIGHATNNIAEYRAMIEGLRRCGNHTRGRVRCFSDSMVVVQQVLGNWQIHQPDLHVLKNQVDIAVLKFEDVTFQHVLRSHPMIARADTPVNRALRERGLASRRQRFETHLVKSEIVRNRGWTDNHIDPFLGAPDQTRPNPYRVSGAPMRLYDVTRVEDVEQTPERREAHERTQSRRARTLRARA